MDKPAPGWRERMRARRADRRERRQWRRERRKGSVDADAASIRSATQAYGQLGGGGDGPGAGSYGAGGP